MLYTGRMTGAFYNQKGGGANFLCPPNDPEYHTLNTKPLKHYSRFMAQNTSIQLLVVMTTMYHVLFATLQQEQLKWWFLPRPAALQTGQESTTAIYRVKLMEARMHWVRLCGQRSSLSLWITCKYQWSSNLSCVRAACRGIQCPLYNANDVLTCTVCTN